MEGGLRMKIEPRRTGETAKEYAYRILRDNIASLELEPGSAISDVEISQMIGISRTPVREAIIKLKEESGIIEIFPQRGMRVALIDPEVVQEVRFLRVTLEKAVAEQACELAREEDFAWFGENLALQEFYLKSNLPERMIELDDALHRRLFVICRKELIYRMSQGLAIHFDRVRSLEAVAAFHTAKTVEDHKNLVQAIRDRDKERARQVIETHLDQWLVNQQKLKERYPQYFKAD